MDYWSNIFIVVTQDEKQKKSRMFSIKTTDHPQYRQLIRDGFRSYRFTDQKNQRTVNIIVKFPVMNIERFTAYVFDEIKDMQEKRVDLS